MTIMKGWLNELMMLDKLRGRDEKNKRANVASKLIIPTSLMFPPISHTLALL